MRAVQAVLVTIDPINLAAVWAGYGPTEVGAFLGAIKDALGDRAAALLVGHTGKAAAKTDEPTALDILGSGAWSHRARCCFVARASKTHIELHLVKANYALQGSTWAYTATSTGALEQVDLLAAQRAKHDEDDAKVLEHMPAHPGTISPTQLTTLVHGGGKGAKGGQRKPAVDASLSRLEADGKVIQAGKRWSISKIGVGG